MTKVVVFLLLSILIFGLGSAVAANMGPQPVADVAIQQMERDDAPAVALRTYRTTKPYVLTAMWLVWGLFVLLYWKKEIFMGIKHLKTISTLLLIVLSLSAVGCRRRPVNKPVFVEISNSETAFLVELDGDNDQAAMDSKAYLEENMVAVKRVEIPYQWVSTGREWQRRVGYYQPTVQLIVVDRKPESREWTSDANTGTSSSNQGIWVESSDSVSFSTGISITARILEDNAVTFLYNYPAKPNREIDTGDKFKDSYMVRTTSLADIMDTEVRPKIQEVFAEESAKENMDELRGMKNDILTAIREDVIPFFEERGITITTIGMFGGFTYQNPEIQQSIDSVFVAQQDKQVAIAETSAAEQRKEALRLLGEGEAAQLEAAAAGEAAAIQAVADAKAYELEMLQANPEAYMLLKQLEIEAARLEAWDGTYPTYYLGNDLGVGGQSLNMFLPSPTPTSIQ